MKSKVVDHTGSSEHAANGVTSSADTPAEVAYSAAVLEAAQFVADRSRELNRRLA